MRGGKGRVGKGRVGKGRVGKGKVGKGRVGKGRGRVGSKLLVKVISHTFFQLAMMFLNNHGIMMLMSALRAAVVSFAVMTSSLMSI